MDDRIKCLTPWDIESTRVFSEDGAFMTLYAKQGGGGGYVMVDTNKANIPNDDEKVICLQGGGRTSQNSQGSGVGKDVSFTLNVIDVHGVCYGISRSALKGGNGSTGGMPIDENVQPTITANGEGAVCCHPKITGALCANSHPGSYTGQDAFNNMLPVYERNNNGEVGSKYIIRRLTPTECARLQGFPDWWVDGANGSDSAIYKMWGNGIALPCAADVIGRIKKAMEGET